VSEVTKNKLNKFQYKPVSNDQSKDATINEEAPASDSGVIPSKEDDDKTAVTPMNRLTWKDFMEPTGAAEEDTHISPNERIMWDSKPGNLYDNALSPMMARKSRKRARSSSPISSPAHDDIKTPAVNVKKLAKALKSPHADPTLELWDRYSLNKSDTHTTPVGLANPALAQLMISSSPRPSKESLGSPRPRNLRRAVSSGLNGPKRRKIEMTRACSTGSNSQREMEAASKSSLVTHLLDSVNSSIQEASPEPPMARSPSPKKRVRSPVKESTPCRAAAEEKAPDSFSDYDDDFDDDTFMELEASITAPAPIQFPDRPNKTELEDTCNKAQEKHETSTGEEFGDLDDDIFNEEELNNARPQASADALRSPSPKKPTAATKPKSGRGSAEFEDEFSDLDDEDIDFDAVELAATQSLERAKSSTQTVR
jgi:DNA replication ATP-dependent helicase Dna2